MTVAAQNGRLYASLSSRAPSASLISRPCFRTARNYQGAVVRPRFVDPAGLSTARGPGYDGAEACEYTPGERCQFSFPAVAAQYAPAPHGRIRRTAAPDVLFRD